MKSITFANQILYTSNIEFRLNKSKVFTSWPYEESSLNEIYSAGLYKYSVCFNEYLLQIFGNSAYVSPLHNSYSLSQREWEKADSKFFTYFSDKHFLKYYQNRGIEICTLGNRRLRSIQNENIIKPNKYCFSQNGKYLMVGVYTCKSIL